MSLPVRYWKNIKGTSNRSCNCGSWKNHWEKYSSINWPKYCSVEGCNECAEVGAHVRNDVNCVNYIVPMCNSCNQKEGLFSLKNGTKLVPENKCKTLHYKPQ